MNSNKIMDRLTLYSLVLFSLLTDICATKNMKIIVQQKPNDCYIFAAYKDTVLVNLKSYLDNGEMFDSLLQPEKSVIFILGSVYVVGGWDRGIEGMCIGEERKLIIPAAVVYGKVAHPPVVPANATVIFEVKLMNLVKSPSHAHFTLVQWLAIIIFVICILLSLYKIYQINRGL